MYKREEVTLDKKLLQDIFNIPSRSHQEGLMKIFIERFLMKQNIKYTEDSKGNIYNINNDTPLLSAHMDTVQDENDAKLAIYAKIRGNIISGYGVIGGDDKCGIFVILSLLRERKDYNFIFSVEEEAGGTGIKFFIEENNLEHIPYGIVLDRRGANDIICEKNDYGTRAFENVLIKLGQVFGYKPALGTFSDADYLNEQISVANLSVGYHNAHMKSEFVKINELENAIKYTWYLTKHITEKYAKPIKTFTRYYNSDTEYGDDYYDDYEKTFACMICNDFSFQNHLLSSIDKYICNACFLALSYDVDEINAKNKPTDVENTDFTELQDEDIEHLCMGE